MANSNTWGEDMNLVSGLSATMKKSTIYYNEPIKLVTCYSQTIQKLKPGLDISSNYGLKL